MISHLWGLYVSSWKVQSCPPPPPPPPTTTIPICKEKCTRHQLCRPVTLLYCLDLIDMTILVAWCTCLMKIESLLDRWMFDSDITVTAYSSSETCKQTIKTWTTWCSIWYNRAVGVGAALPGAAAAGPIICSVWLASCWILPFHTKIAPETISEGQNFPGGGPPYPPKWRTSRAWYASRLACCAMARHAIAPHRSNMQSALRLTKLTLLPTGLYKVLLY